MVVLLKIVNIQVKFK